MSLTTVLPNIKIMGVDNKKTYIPLEHNVYSTQRVGRVVPYMTRFADANGKHKIDLETLNYMAPMIAPTVGNISLKHWLYWVSLDKLSPTLANLLAKQKAVKYDATEFDVTEVPYIYLHHLTTLCLIGSFCTIYFKDHKKGGTGLLAPLPWQDGKTYLFPSNYSNDGATFMDGIENIWNGYTSGDFINDGTVTAGNEGKTLFVLTPLKKSPYKTRNTIEQIVKSGGFEADSSNGFKNVETLLQHVEQGKEYYFVSSEHAAIIRKINKNFEYLELQNKKMKNGFKPLSVETLEARFGTEEKSDCHDYLIDIEKMKNSPKFRELIGFFNTQE